MGVDRVPFMCHEIRFQLAPKDNLKGIHCSVRTHSKGHSSLGPFGDNPSAFCQHVGVAFLGGRVRRAQLQDAGIYPLRHST